MLGILAARFVFLLCDQKPSLITTAPTGTVFSLAKGECDKSITPASLLLAASILAASPLTANSESRPPALGCALATAVGTIESAAEAINVRRDNLVFIEVLLLRTAFIVFL